MPIDPLEYLASEYANSGKELPSSLKDLKGSKESEKTMGSTEDRTRSVADLGLDNLSEYADYLDLDKTNVIRQDVNKMRAENQGNWEQGLNAIAGGTVKGLATAVEDASYILDFESHLNAARGIDDWERNAIADWAIDFKGGVDDAMPIYRESNEVFDWGDSGFYWQSLSGIIDSAVGFGLPGGAVAKGVGALTKAAKIEKLLAFATKTDKAADVFNALGSAGVNTWAEGTMMGYETFDETKESMFAARERGEITLSDAEINTLAGEAANEMRTGNMAMIATNAFAMHGLAKGKGSLGTILKERNVKNRFKELGKTLYKPNSDNLILQGLGEAGEEMVQGGIQQEARYQAEVKAGLDRDGVSDNYLARMFEFSTSDQALLEGMMGFFGGGPQRILSEATSGRHTKSAKEEYKRRYDAQQQVLSANAEYIQDSSKLYAKATEEAAAYRKAGHPKLADSIEESVMASRVIANLESGTIEQYETDLNSIIDEGGVKDAQGNIKPEAVEVAKKSLEIATDLKNEWIRNSSKANVGAIVRNRVNNKQAETFRDVVAEQYTEASRELQKAIDVLTFGKQGAVKNKKGEEIDLDYSVEGILNNPFNMKQNWDASELQDKLIKKMSSSPQFKEAAELKKTLATANEELGNIQENYTKLKSDAGQKEYIREIKELAKTREKDTAKRESTVQNPTNTTDAKIGKTYQDNNGTIYKYDNVLPDGRMLMIKEGGKAGKPISESEFNERFVKDGKLTSRENKKDLANSIKESEAKDNNKESTDNIVATSPTEFVPNAQDIEPSNETKASTDYTDNKSKDPMSLAWMSSNNTRSVNPTEEKKAITEYLESSDNLLAGTRVRISIDTSMSNKNDSLDRLKEEGALKVELLDDNGDNIKNKGFNVYTHLHLPGFGSDLNYVNQSEAFRESVLKKLTSGDDYVYSTIESKSLGNVVNDKVELNNNIKAIIGEENSKNIRLMARSSDGNLYTGSIAEAGSLVSDIDGSYKPDAPKGTIFMDVKGSNGESFPARLNIRTLTPSESELISNIYISLANGTISYKDSIESDRASILRNNIAGTEELTSFLNTIVKSNPEYKNTKDVTVGEIISELVYEGSGENLSDVKYPLFLDYDKKMVNFGNNIITFAELNANPLQLTDWLTANKIRNVKMNKLNNTSYKNYILDNNVLTTDLVSNDNGDGVKFIQPTIKINPSLITAEPVVSDMKADPITELFGAPSTGLSLEDLNKLAPSSPKSKEEVAKAVTNTTSKTIDKYTTASNEILENVKEENKVSAKEKLDGGSFKEFWDGTLMLGEEDTDVNFERAKIMHTEQLNNC